MPQLSPLNWILLFLYFWASLSGLSVLTWWEKEIFLQGNWFQAKLIELGWMW